MRGQKTEQEQHNDAGVRGVSRGDLEANQAAVLRRSMTLTDRSTATIMSDPPSPCEPFSPEEFDLSRVGIEN